jgi:hypothetical protein
MCQKRKRTDIETDIAQLEELMFEISATDPQWETMVKQRNELYIELEHEDHPVKNQKQAFTNLKFITK